MHVLLRLCKVLTLVQLYEDTWEQANSDYMCFVALEMA